MPNDINTQITRIMDNVAAAYTAALAKGATMPQNQNSDNLADTVASIAIPQTQTKSATPSLSSQTITPDSGKLLSGVTVNPITASLLASLDADFIAANIAEGVDMFGVVGTMPGVFVGSFTLTNRQANTTVTHGLGRVPSGCAIRVGTLTGTSSTPMLLMAYGTTSGILCVTASTSIGSNAYSGSITDASASSGSINWIYGANSTTISFGTVQSGRMDRTTYFFTLW